MKIDLDAGLELIQNPDLQISQKKTTFLYSVLFLFQPTL